MRVLLVDDEPELVFTLAERLSLRGYKVEAVTDGKSALEWIKSEHFDVMVVDVKMPGMGGYEVLQAVQQLAPQLPVILLTGHGGNDDTDGQMLQRSCAYLYKPVKLEELIAAMSACVKEPLDA